MVVAPLPGQPPVQVDGTSICLDELGRLTICKGGVKPWHLGLPVGGYGVSSGFLSAANLLRFVVPSSTSRPHALWVASSVEYANVMIATTFKVTVGEDFAAVRVDPTFNTWYEAERVQAAGIITLPTRYWYIRYLVNGTATVLAGPLAGGTNARQPACFEVSGSELLLDVNCDGTADLTATHTALTSGYVGRGSADSDYNNVPLPFLLMAPSSSATGARFIGVVELFEGKYKSLDDDAKKAIYSSDPNATIVIAKPVYDALSSASEPPDVRLLDARPGSQASLAASRSGQVLRGAVEVRSRGDAAKALEQARRSGVETVIGKDTLMFHATGSRWFLYLSNADWCDSIAEGVLPKPRAPTEQMLWWLELLEARLRLAAAIGAVKESLVDEHLAKAARLARLGW